MLNLVDKNILYNFMLNNFSMDLRRWKQEYKDKATMDVPRPLSNDLWVNLFQKVDAGRLKWANRAGTSVYVSKIL